MALVTEARLRHLDGRDTAADDYHHVEIFGSHDRDRAARAPMPVAAPVMSTVPGSRGTSVVVALDHGQGENPVADAPAAFGHFLDEDHSVTVTPCVCVVISQVG
jgi:hypothetical protein